ncbi:MAG: hypothetical protein ACLGHN_00170 [Bacteriovoracia bacterium]
MRALFFTGILLSSTFASAASFDEVWNVIITPTKENKIYEEELPMRKHSLTEMLESPVDIFEAAKRAITDQGDLFPKNTKKLIRGNGICLAGKWVITKDTPYSGYFAKGAEGLIILRASVGFDETTRGSFRSFGMAGKLFPTLNPAEKVKSANFFLIDDNAGTKRAYYMDAPLLSEAKVTYLNILTDAVRDFSVSFIRMLLTVEKAQKKADDESKIRQLYPLSRAGLKDIRYAKSPALMKIVGSKNLWRVDEDDFRNELRVKNYPAAGTRSENPYRIKFDIHVAPERNKKPAWSESIGYIEIFEDVVSDACDMRLRFPHPMWDKNAR